MQPTPTPDTRRDLGRSGTLDGSLGAWDALLLGPASAVRGLTRGLAGGLGAIEFLPGASLGLHQVSQAQLGVGVALSRVLTFWVWLPIGWAAVAWASWVARRLVPDAPDPAEGGSPVEEAESVVAPYPVALRGEEVG